MIYEVRFAFWKHLLQLVLTNYVNAEQSSKKWCNTRSNEIISSRLELLVGLHGNKKFYNTWEVWKLEGKKMTSLVSKMYSMGYCLKMSILNSSILKKNRDLLPSHVVFFSSQKSKLWDSPDGSGPNGSHVEIKTRVKTADKFMSTLLCPISF